MNVSLAAHLSKVNQPVPSKKLITVSCLGDSITAGSFNYPHSSSIWYPTYANHLLARDSTVTRTCGDNRFISDQAALSPGSSLSRSEFTLAASSATPYSKVEMSHRGLLPVDEGLYLLQGELIGNLSIGAHLAVGVYGVDHDDQIVEDSWQFAGSYEVDRLGYAKVSYTFSPRFIASLDPTIVKVGIGGLLESEGQISMGQLRNIQLSALSSGIAIHNQGVSYTSVAEGLATIGKVIRWQPDVCIVAYGTNDIRNGVSWEDYCTDLVQLVNTLREHRIFPIIATLPPLGKDQVNYDQVPAWNELITAKANELGIGLWDRWQAFYKGDLSFIEDGRHPTRKGYLRLGEDLVRFLSEAMLR
ncbi:MAG: hypothetical protein GX382_05640 [Syntrophomonadaceae bacterium]|jgi:lysophospholipase L1-like esterase|nr:hypothetical protein [Syntrophomonadaceae bacterium]